MSSLFFVHSGAYDYRQDRKLSQPFPVWSLIYLQQKPTSKKQQGQTFLVCFSLVIRYIFISIDPLGRS